MPTRDIGAEMGWARRMQPHANYYYTDYFGDHKRFDVEGAGQDDGGIDRTLDYSGIDQIVKPSRHTTIHVAQRFRRDRGDDGPTDFSIRYRSNGPSEYARLLRGYASDYGHLPGLYAFGVADAADPDDNGFGEFYLLDVDRFVGAIVDEVIDHSGPYPNFVNGKPDGTEAIYFAKNDLRRIGAIVAEWDGCARK